MAFSKPLGSDWLKRALVAALLLVVVPALGPGTLAQNDDRAGAPRALSIETSEDGLVLT